MLIVILDQIVMPLNLNKISTHELGSVVTQPIPERTPKVGNKFVRLGSAYKKSAMDLIRVCSAEFPLHTPFIFQIHCPAIVKTVHFSYRLEA